MQKASRLALWGLLAGGLVLGLAGCDGVPTTQAHKQQVNAANEHWLKMRSNLMLGMAQQQFDSGDLDQADKTLNEAFSQDPKNPRIIILVGRIALERGQLERAAQRFTEASTLDPKIPDAHYFEGIVFQRWQRYDKALDQYRQAFDLEHDNVSYLLAMSEMMVATDKVDGAIALMTDKAVYFDQSAAVRVALGQLYTMKLDYVRAVKLFQTALVLKPDDNQIIEALAQAQVQAGQDENAVENLEKLCRDKDGGQRRDLQRELAMEYVKVGRPNDAKGVLLKLTQSDPDDAETWIRLGEVAWAMQDSGGTLLAAGRAMNLAPKSQEGYLLAGLVWQQRGRLDEALEMFDRAAELAPKSADPMVLRGIALEHAGRTTAAAQAYAEALRRRPDDQRVKTLLANVSTERESDKTQP